MDKTMAFNDQIKPEGTRVGLMHCYCLNQFIQINFKVMDIIFEDNKTYCNTWLEKYTLSNAFVYLVAAGIAIFNVIVKGILRCMFFIFNSS